MSSKLDIKPTTDQNTKCNSMKQKQSMENLNTPIDTCRNGKDTKHHRGRGYKHYERDQVKQSWVRFSVSRAQYRKTNSKQKPQSVNSRMIGRLKGYEMTHVNVTLVMMTFDSEGKDRKPDSTMPLVHCFDFFS